MRELRVIAISTHTIFFCYTVITSKHDYIVHQKDRLCGPRVLTFFLYLSDVDEGGGTSFADLGIVVSPKKGRALLWPSVMNYDPSLKDGRTRHEVCTDFRIFYYNYVDN